MTEFQRKVYNVVKKIPRGRVLTYGEVARRLGDRNLARAVGIALNKNRDKAIPCHRVVRSDGQLGGYNRGVKNKELILKEEGVRIGNQELEKEVL